MVDCSTQSVIVGAAEFMSAAVMICIGITVIAGTTVLLNRLISKYWVPVKLFTYHSVVDDKTKIKEPKF